MNQQSKFKWQIAAALVAAFALYYGTQLILAWLVQWACRGVA